MLDEPDHVWSAPLESLTEKERADFEEVVTGEILPEVGSRMMTRLLTGQDMSGDWVVVQDGVYRYCLAQHGIILVRSVLFEYLATEVYWGS